MCLIIAPLMFLNSLALAMDHNVMVHSESSRRLVGLLRELAFGGNVMGLSIGACFNTLRRQKPGSNQEVPPNIGN